MKTMKFFLAALTVMCAMTATTVFTACGDDDDDNGKNAVIEANKPASVQLNLDMPLTEDMLQYCDIVITYNDGTGEKTETPTTKRWTKTLSSNLPASFTFSRTVRMKSNVDPNTIGTFRLARGYIPTAYIFSVSGVNIGAASNVNGGGSTNEMEPTGSVAAEIINRGTIDISARFDFDANGKRM